MKANVDYPDKYLKRPPIGDTRIKRYDGSSVTYEYLDHYIRTTDVMTLPVLDFIARLISHIPDKNFRNIRYYGFLANRVRGKLLPIVYRPLNMKGVIKRRVYIPSRRMIKDVFGYDPLKCPICNTTMIWKYMARPFSVPLVPMHKEIAHGYFPLLC